jgi:glycosyltransferase involved in cell wall biosynthesis
MRKVLFIVGSLGSGGIERQVSDMALYLMGQTEFTPVICCILKREGQFLKTMLDANIEVMECSIRKGPISFVLNMRKLVILVRPEIVHSHVAFSLLWQTISYKIGGVRKVIFTQQNEYQNWNSFISKIRLRFYYYFSKIFINNYTCVSNRVITSLADLLFEKTSAFSVIHNSYDDSQFYPRPGIRESIRLDLGIESKLFTIVVVGRFAKQKGHPYLIAACKAIAEEGLNFKVVFIGTGAEMIQCETLVKDLGIADKFMFLGNRPDVNLILSGMD